jgi:hypothetical protein
MVGLAAAIERLVMIFAGHSSGTLIISGVSQVRLGQAKHCISSTILTPC